MEELIQKLSLHRLFQLDNHSHRINSMIATCLKQNQLKFYKLQKQKMLSKHQKNKQTKEKNLKGPNLFFFNFNNNRHKHGSYDFHNVEEEEPH